MKQGNQSKSIKFVMSHTLLIDYVNNPMNQNTEITYQKQNFVHIIYKLICNRY